MMTATSGLQCLKLSPQYGPVGSVLKTLLGSMVWSSTVCSLIWRRRATPSGFVWFQLVPLTHGTDETGFGLLPTMTVFDMAKTKPTASSLHKQGSMHSMTLMDVMLLPTRSAWEAGRGRAAKDTYYTTETGTVRHRNKAGSSSFVGLIPTITANENKGSGRARFAGSPEYRGAKASEALRASESDPIYLNPNFAEVFMGYPQDWTLATEETDCELSETPSCPP